MKSNLTPNLDAGPPQPLTYPVGHLPVPDIDLDNFPGHDSPHDFTERILYRVETPRPGIEVMRPGEPSRAMWLPFRGPPTTFT